MERSEVRMYSENDHTILGEVFCVTQNQYYNPEFEKSGMEYTALRIPEKNTDQMRKACQWLCKKNQKFMFEEFRVFKVMASGFTIYENLTYSEINKGNIDSSYLNEEDKRRCCIWTFLREVQNREYKEEIHRTSRQNVKRVLHSLR
jgi:hypothetical protein